jgi:hypothetical protein
VNINFVAINAKYFCFTRAVESFNFLSNLHSIDWLCVSWLNG